MNYIDPLGLEDVKFGGDRWRKHKYDPDTTKGEHYHNLKTGEKYFPETNEIYDPKTKKTRSAGKKWQKKWNEKVGCKDGEENEEEPASNEGTSQNISSNNAKMVIVIIIGGVIWYITHIGWWTPVPDPI